MGLICKLKVVIDFRQEAKRQEARGKGQGARGNKQLIFLLLLIAYSSVI